MVFKLPTYQNCLEICEKSSGIFYESKFVVDGYNISIFNYRLATYKDFFIYKAFELRGLTFVFNSDNTLFKRFILMEKFFNLGENESTHLDLVLKKDIKSIYQKEDGSIINFIQLPNGKIVAKSKASFDSDQAKEAQMLFENNIEISDFVTKSLNSGLMSIFEYVGPRNRVVVKYESTDLVLLRLRDNSSGKYVDIDDISFKKPETFTYSLEDLISLKEGSQGIEGWIVEFGDNQKVKIKTDWYLSLHKIFTDYSNREDYLIDLILSEKIDDVLSVLDLGSESRIFVESVIKKTNEKILSYIKEVQTILNYFDGDRKTLAMKYKSNEIFPILMQSISGKDLDYCVKEYVRKKTYRLFEAREWLNN